MLRGCVYRVFYGNGGGCFLMAKMTLRADTGGQRELGIGKTRARGRTRVENPYGILMK